MSASQRLPVIFFGHGNPMNALADNVYTRGWRCDWAVRFVQKARAWMLARDHQPLIDYETLGEDAALSAPTPDHYLPLLYVLGAQLPGDNVSFPIDGVDGGSISMLTVQLS